MMAYLTVTLLCLALSLGAFTEAKKPKPTPSPSPATPSRPPPLTHNWLKFKDASTPFRILQISDVHYQNGATTTCKDITPDQLPCSDLNSTAWLTALLQKEKPNLVIFTGDNIVYDGIDYVASQNALTKPLNDAKIPYMMTFGNHDCENDNTTTCRPTLIKEGKKMPYSLTQAAPVDLGVGVATYAYTIAGPDGKPAFALYIFDGGAYMKEFPGSYDFIRPNQVEWYNKTSVALEKSAGKKIPAAAFFHIPLPEVDSAYLCASNAAKYEPTGSWMDWSVNRTKAGTGKALADGKCGGKSNPNVTGEWFEGVYSANVNGGLFSAFAFRGDVKMVNVGHDHVNDFCASMYNVRFCYGGGFGYHAYGKQGWPRRARTIDVNFDGSLTTYKTLDAWGKYAEIDRETIP